MSSTRFPMPGRRRGAGHRPALGALAALAAVVPSAVAATTADATVPPPPAE